MSADSDDMYSKQPALVPLVPLSRARRIEGSCMATQCYTGVGTVTANTHKPI